MQAKTNFPIKTDQLEVGDRIILVDHKTNSYDRGEIKFKGPTQGNKPDYIWFGIALDRAKGKHDGKGYFKTEENRGLFATIENIRKIVEEDFDLKLFKKLHKKGRIAELDQPAKADPDPGDQISAENLTKDMINKMEGQFLKKEKKRKKKIKELKKVIKELKKDHKKELGQLRESQKRLRLDLEQAKILIEERELKIEELEYDMEIAILQAQIESREQNEAERLSSSEFRQNYEYLKAGFRILESRYERLLKSNSSYKDVQDKLWVAERENSRLSKQVDELKGFEDYSNSLSEKIKKNEKKIEELREDNKKLEQQQEVSDDIICEFENVVNACEKVIQTLEKKNKDLTLSAEKLDFKLKESDKQLKDYRRKLRTLDGEFDVAEMDTENDDAKAYVKKIEKLAKSYSECLKERNQMVHSMTDWRIRETKKIAERSRWSVIMASVPLYLKKRIDDKYLQNFLELYEMSKEVELVLEIFRDHYLKSHFIIHDNIKLIDFIYTISKTLLDTLKICDFMFDYGFSMKNWEDFKSLMKSPFFKVAASTKAFLRKLVDRIKTDKLEKKFSLKPLAGNNKKMSKICKIITNKYKDVQNRKTIELRIASTYIDLVYMYFCAQMMNQGTRNQDFFKQSNLLQEINKNVINDQSWANSQARLFDYKNVEKSRYKFNDFKRLKKLIFGEASKYEEADKINFEDLTNKILPKIKKFVSKYGVSCERVDSSPTLYQLLATEGPWSQKIRAVKRELEEHNQLVHEKIKQERKIKELQKEIVRRDEDRQSLLRVQTMLQKRIQKLEGESQKAIFFERETERFKLKESHWEQSSEELKKEVASLREECESLTASKFSLTQSEEETPKDQDPRTNSAYTDPHQYSTVDKLALITMENRVKRSSALMMEQKAKNTMDALQRMKRGMPRYQEYFNLKEKKKSKRRRPQEDGKNPDLASDAKKTLTKLNGIRCAVRKAISSKKLIDLSAESAFIDDSGFSPETNQSRLLRISAEIENQEDGLRTSIYRAGKELEAFKQRWAEDPFQSSSRTQIEGPHVAEALNREDADQTKVGKLKIGDQSVSSVFSGKIRLKKADHPIFVKSEGLSLKSLIAF